VDSTTSFLPHLLFTIGQLLLDLFNLENLVENDYWDGVG
jgi:hypothetical protein